MKSQVSENPLKKLIQLGFLKYKNNESFAPSCQDSQDDTESKEEFSISGIRSIPSVESTKVWGKNKSRVQQCNALCRQRRIIRGFVTESYIDIATSIWNMTKCSHCLARKKSQRARSENVQQNHYIFPISHLSFLLRYSRKENVARRFFCDISLCANE